MGLEQFWRCDFCRRDTQVAHPAGWRLKGQRHDPEARRPDKSFDLYLCSDSCAEKWFADFNRHSEVDNLATIVDRNN